MHLKSPRIAPVTEPNEDQGAALAPVSANGPPLNIFRTLAHAPAALTAFLTWGSYILSKKNALPPREREIVILRIGFLCRSGYEWTQHAEIGKRSGLTDDEIERIKSGQGFSAADTALIRACDELHARQFISDAAWAELKAHFSEKQCMDAVFTAGQYTQVSMMLNTFGVQLDPGQTLDPDLRA
jgi:alkylhydroperoxidase family enzyme